MESPVICVLVLALVSFITAPAYSQSIHASQNPLPVGSSVTLYSNSSVLAGAWMFNNDIIVMLFPGNEILSDQWINRVTFNSTTSHSSLTIRSLQVADSGVYTLQALNSFRVQLVLSVQVPVSNATLRAQATDLVEFNDTAVLMCTVSSGSSLSYVWLNGSSEVTANGGSVQLRDGGATLVMVGVTRNDKGPFWCNVSNGVSYEISPLVLLNISYGPSNAKIMVTPMMHVYRTGSNITVSCSVDSSPTATIQWMFNGVNLNHFTPWLHLESITEGSSGNYQCLYHNPVTSRSTTARASIQVMAPIVAVVVNDTGKPAILHEMFALHCEVAGVVDSIHWFRNGQLVYADKTTVLALDNRTLILIPVQHSDNGDYYCQAFNYVSNMTSSPYTLQVNYGPMPPEITAPTAALTGAHKVLNCSSASHPPSRIQWSFNDSLLANTSTLAIGPLTLNMSGTYMCKAFNDITNKTSIAFTMLTVFAPVTMASVQIAAGQPILNHTFTLTCETVGSVKSIIWMYNGYPLSGDDTRILSMDNATLTFSPIVQTDNGQYQCTAFNPVSSLASENFTLEFFYGPETPAIMGPTLAQAGDSVTLTCNASSNPPSNYTWLFNDTVVANMSEYVTPPLTVNMSGMYTCMAYNNVTDRHSFANTILNVHDVISLVQVVAPGYPAIEGHLYSLMCHVTGPAEHVYWMKNGELLHGDNRTSLYTENKTLAFGPLEKNDTGIYQCMASNAVGNMTSPYYHLVVNFGPEEPTIMGRAFAETGGMISFHCYAESTPSSRYSWWFNGSEVANTSWFYTNPVSFNMSGEYTCVAYNDVTGKNSTNSVTLTVIEAIESVAIRNESVPIDHENFTLACEVTGPYDAVYWIKDGINLNMSAYADEGLMSYYTENNTLRFTPVMIDNDGVYSCVATNQAGRHASPAYLLQVNYGPLSVNISGPTSAGVNSSVTLMCSADSRPDCDFHWFFNNQSSLLHAGSSLTIPAVQTNEGNYICRARNPVTNITMYQTKAVTFGHASAITVPSKGSLLMMGVFALSLTVLHN